MSYDAFASTFSKSRENLRWKEIDYFMELTGKRFRDRQVSILDVGCGNGRLLKALERSGLRYSYQWIDESTGMISEARKLHPHNEFRTLDMTRLEELHTAETYDIVTFIASFHHLHTEKERTETLRKTKHLLKDGGIIAMMNWNLLGDELFAKYAKSHQWNGDFRIKIGTHERYYHGFTISELESLFQENGYRILENRVFEGGKNIISIVTNQ